MDASLWILNEMSKKRRKTIHEKKENVKKTVFYSFELLLVLSKLLLPFIKKGFHSFDINSI